MTQKSMDASRMTVLAVHGIQGTSAAWNAVAEACAAQAHFICPNLRGRADASRGRGPEDYRLDTFSQDLLKIARNQLDDSPFILAGWSMGVSVALEYLRQNEGPQPCGLILLSGSPRPGLAPWFSQQGDSSLDLGRATGGRSHRQSWSHPPSNIDHPRRCRPGLASRTCALVS